MNREELLDTYVISSIVKIFDPAIAEVVNINYKFNCWLLKLTFECYECNGAHRDVLRALFENIDFTQTCKRKNGNGLQHALKHKEPLDFKHKNIINMLPWSETLEYGKRQNNEENLKEHNNAELNEQYFFNHSQGIFL